MPIRQTFRTSFPGFIEPARPNIHKAAPSGAKWIHEIKFDGYRIQAHVNAGRASLWTRNGYDYTDRYPDVAAALKALPITDAIFDGEMIVPNHGGGDFTALHSRKRHSDVQYQIFDLLWLNGSDLRGEWLSKRKDALSAVVPTAVASPLKFVEWIEKTDGAQVVASACDLRLEGVVSKLVDAPYRSGDKTDWVKVKCSQRAEYLIVGYVPSTRGRGVEAQRLARRNGRKLEYVGKVGTGFSAKSGAEVRAKLEPLMRQAAALTKPIDKPGTVWVEPRFSAEIVYLEEVEGGLRHASFKRLI